MGLEKLIAESGFTRKQILDAYIDGFACTSCRLEPENHKIGVLQKAYKLGKNHYYVGDDIRKIDLMSDDDIILEILKE
jgi:hypothetical protein